MDAADVNKAWTLMERGLQPSSDEARRAGDRVPETMERLAACAYGMAQVGENRIIPSCVQHAVYDPAENQVLREALPLYGPRRRESAEMLQAQEAQNPGTVHSR
eukprot:Plantae.Rhodophyta-Rhodochaete_pulchella.ctg11722.p1 GENE.Plantae.Rhodophyta-Rhodochaete_pulchella.ctg11722~~Plantae.Rhodophyta-Rhodochaete_pulchella.ctg11722.p1  ORF type:complete len:113 (+),score=16.62 Plantae.Rhodophyta-Rhodochaete_pulchella.ctg11722:30-341(+)